MSVAFLFNNNKMSEKEINNSIHSLKNNKVLRSQDLNSGLSDYNCVFRAAEPLSCRLAPSCPHPLLPHMIDISRDFWSQREGVLPCQDFEGKEYHFQKKKPKRLNFMGLTIVPAENNNHSSSQHLLSAYCSQARAQRFMYILF